MMISPFQYLIYLSKLELSFTNGVLSNIRGGLVRMGSELPEDPQIAQRVAHMQADPQYAAL